MVKPPYRIFISVPADTNLSPNQLALKQRIVELVTQAGYKPEIFGELGSFVNQAWTFENIDQDMRQCQGIIVLGLARFECQFSDGIARFVTEYSHYEGAVAHTLGLPMLLIREAGVLDRGIVSTNAGKYIVRLPQNADANWINSNAFMDHFNAWKDQINQRFHVFLGYSGAARPTAASVKSFLQTLGARVMDWRTDFPPGSFVLDSIQQAEQKCLGGIFLFMKDDQVVSKDVVTEAPRDNVVFEAGYFMNTKGSSRTLLIREQEAKILSDLNGMSYLEVPGRAAVDDSADITGIENQLRKFINGF